jgi:ligand-binding sensor domain-containing protein
VENLLSENNLDKDVLSAAGDEMDASQKKMNDYPMIKAMQTARADFTNMMNQVNTLIRFVVTGETEQPKSGCSGSCEGCSGCEK